MKRKVIIKKAIAVAVTMSLMTCLVPNGSITVNAASKKSMLSKTKISVNVGKKKTVKLKKAKYKVVWKIISGKKNISIKKKGKYKQKIQIKGKNIGKAKIKAVYGKKKYILKVTVKGNNKENIFLSNKIDAFSLLCSSVEFFILNTYRIQSIYDQS